MNIRYLRYESIKLGETFGMVGRTFELPEVKNALGSGECFLVSIGEKFADCLGLCVLGTVKFYYDTLSRSLDSHGVVSALGDIDNGAW